ncbi:cell division protein ZapA [Methylomagnum sp.]
MSEINPPIKVQILGKEYPISCPPEEQHDLLMAARYLDEKMRQIRGTGRVIGSERIAVMAALNIAHELLLANQRNKSASQDVPSRYNGDPISGAE